jgi:formylmethanofuran dehydrogenase subunit B
MPLVYGLSNITCEAQREAVGLAELIGGVIDSHTSL